MRVRVIYPRMASRLTFLTGVGAAGTLFASVVLSGAQPPWAWGFVQGFVLVLAGVWLLVQILHSGPEVQRLVDPTARWVVVPGLGLLAWIGLSYVLDAWVCEARGTEPLARAPTVFAYFLVACFLLGMSLGSRHRFPVLVGGLFCLGVVVALFGLLRLYLSHWPSLWGFETGGRLQSFYTNANRVAVLLALSWACGAGWTGYWWCRATRNHIASEAVRERAIAVAVSLGTLLTAVAMVLTLSRMTLLSSLLAVLLVSGVSAYAIRHPRTVDDPELGSHPKLRSLLFPAGLILMVVLLLLGLSFTVGGHGLASRMEATPIDTSGRLELMKTGLMVWGERPLTGTGLGTLESRFSGVCPPAQQDLRVVEVHNDWLQLGIELGAVGLLLAAVLVAACAALWWRSIRRAHRLRTRMLLSGAAIAVLVPLLCSLADFPLRQPTTAGLLFLLAGALFYAGMEERDPEPSLPEGLSRCRLYIVRVVGWVLLAIFAVGAVFCFQRGRAVATTPWLGQVYPQVPVAGDVESCARGCEMDPDNADLWYLFATALLERTQQEQDAERKSTERKRFDRATARLIQLNPRDYRPHYLRTLMGYRERRWKDALDDIRLALQHSHFHFLHVLERDLLLLSCRSLPPDSPRRGERLEDALVCLRQGVEAHRWSERAALEAMLLLGLHAGDAVQFWPPTSDANRLARAQFYVRFHLNERARAELNEVGDTMRNNPWFLALRCFLDLSGELEERGLESFSILIRQMGQQPDPGVLAWLQVHLPSLPGRRLLLLVQNESAGIGGHPALCWAMLPKLSSVSLPDADRLWGRVVNTAPTSEHLRRWAELAARMGDRPAARIRARSAWERSSRSDEWNRWYAEFRREWKLND